MTNKFICSLKWPFLLLPMLPSIRLKFDLKIISGEKREGGRSVYPFDLNIIASTIECIEAESKFI